MTTSFKVLYIAGEGRSGSTILDLLLDLHPDVFGAGELWSFFADDATHTGDCSCGRRFTECDFWREVRRRFLTTTGETDLHDSNRERQAWDRARALLQPRRNLRGPGASRYARDTLAVYRILHELSGQSVLVDSTKLVARADNLLRMPDLDVRILHLVRDGRGVVWSRMRDRLRDPAARRHGPARSIVHWVAKNTMARQVARRAGERYLLVRYEDLVTDAQTELRRIGDWCGLDLGATPRGARGRTTPDPGHQIGGNLAARSGGTPRELRLDEEWRQRLPARYDRLYRLLAGPLARRLGYRV